MYPETVTYQMKLPFLYSYLSKTHFLDSVAEEKNRAEAVIKSWKDGIYMAMEAADQINGFYAGQYTMNGEDLTDLFLHCVVSTTQKRGQVDTKRTWVVADHYVEAMHLFRIWHPYREFAMLNFLSELWPLLCDKARQFFVNTTKNGEDYTLVTMGVPLVSNRNIEIAEIRPRLDGRGSPDDLVTDARGLLLNNSQYTTTSYNHAFNIAVDRIVNASWNISGRYDPGRDEYGVSQV